MAILWWESICGRKTDQDAFWNDNLTINTENPDLPICFQTTILVWFPCAFLWMCFPFLWIGYRRSYTIHYHFCDKSLLNLLKLVTGGILCIISLLELCSVIRQEYMGYTPSVARYVAPVVKLFTMVLATFIMHKEYQKGKHTSGVLFFFWLFLTVFGAILFRTNIMLNSQSHLSDHFGFIISILYFVMVVLEFIYSLVSDTSALHARHMKYQSQEKIPILTNEKKSDIDEKMTPEVTASFLSLLTFSWFLPFIFRGFYKTVTIEDLYSIQKEHKSAYLIPKFQIPWRKRIKNYLQHNISYGKQAKLPSLFKYFLKDNWHLMAWAIFYRFLQVTVQAARPLILRLLILFINDAEAPQWQGYFLVAILFLLSLGLSIFLAKGFFVAAIMGLRLRTLVTSAVYRKTLLLSSYTRKTTSTGKIVSLMSIDAKNIQDATKSLFIILNIPSAICFSLIGIILIIGIVPAMIGLVTQLSIISFNALILGKMIAKFQVKRMKCQDKRVKILKEILSGIKVIKLYAWEESFEESVERIRKEELSYLRKAAIINVITNVTSFPLPYLTSLVIFTTYIFQSPDNVLTAQNAFVVLSFINISVFGVNYLPMGISQISQAIISIKRVRDFLLLDELQEKEEIFSESEYAIQISKGNFGWDIDGDLDLKSINLNIKHGQLVAIVGPVGSGKSSLLSAVLGEMHKHEGDTSVKGPIAYVPQEPWIQNNTLQNNILFGKDYICDKYNKIIHACALPPDLRTLVNGDMTEIGEKGINLSGGQKQRVSLARAVYQDQDVYLLDDPLSAVDVHVGQHLFKHVISNKGILRHKTRILATHNIGVLSEVDLIIVLHNGQIAETGSYTELLQHNGAFAEFLNLYLQEQYTDIASDSEALGDLREKLKSLSDSEGGKTAKANGQICLGNHVIKQRKTKRNDEKVLQKPEYAKFNGKLIQEEEAQTGSVNASVLRAYISAGGIKFFALFLVFAILYISSQVMTDLWLSDWSNDGTYNLTFAKQNSQYRLGMYAVFIGCQVLAQAGISTAIALGVISAGRNLHRKLHRQILMAPMSFFDTTPLGRLMNRFTKDINILDVDILHYSVTWVFGTAPILAIMIETIYTTPFFIIVVVPLIIVFIIVQRMVMGTSNQVKRIDSINRSPLFAFFDETLNGISSIRAYQCQERFIAHSDDLLDTSQKCWYHVIAVLRTMTMIFQGLGTIFLLGASIFVVSQKESLTPGLAGLSLSKSMQIVLFICTQGLMGSQLESNIISVERIKEYIEINTEAPWQVLEYSPLQDWPKVGQIEFHNYSTRYRPDLDYVLRGFSLNIQGGEKVGIIGRTGAGKSSITLSLFRIIEAAGGCIVIDGQDISKMGLHDLRSRLSIIPQDPVIFSGSLRMNLDPFSKYDDDAIWKSLEHAYLKQFISTLPSGLEHDCGEGGATLSVGQKQLVCLARALLRKSAILILDEATAAIDLETDDLIQATIRSHFKHCTVLTVAHRINTILDYDKICVLENGKILEFASPNELLADHKSVFCGMVKESGLR